MSFHVLLKREQLRVKHIIESYIKLSGSSNAPLPAQCHIFKPGVVLYTGSSGSVLEAASYKAG